MTRSSNQSARVVPLSDEPGPNDLLRQLFGEPIYEYGDDQAVADGILVPFVASRRDTGHRITRNAFETLKRHYGGEGYEGYTDRRFHDFFLIAKAFPDI